MLGRIPADNGWGVKNELAEFAADQIAWILGRNPLTSRRKHVKNTVKTTVNRDVNQSVSGLHALFTPFIP